MVYRGKCLIRKERKLNLCHTCVAENACANRNSRITIQMMKVGKCLSDNSGFGLDGFRQWGRWVPIVLLVGALSCTRRSEPDTEPSTKPAVTQDRESAPPESPPLAETPERETDWIARYREHYQWYEKEFVPPALLEAIELSFRSGKPISGTLVALEPDHIVLGVISGEIEYPRVMLSAESLSRLYAEQYAQHLAVEAVQREQRKEKEKRKPLPAKIVKTKEPTEKKIWREIESPAANLAGPPENDPMDGSVQQVKEYLKQTVRDPASLKFLSWSDVIKGEKDYRVVCTYRAQAGKFGLVTEKKVFFMDQYGRITAVSAVRQNL